MLGDVWDWTGKLRERETNIGVDPHYIRIELRNLCDDTLAQTDDRNHDFAPLIAFARRTN